MSDELESVAKVGGTALTSAGVTAAFVRWLWARKDKAEDQEKADLRDRLTKLETKYDKLLERIDGAFAAQRADVAKLVDMATRTDERVKMYARRVGEPVTNPGTKLSPEMQALIAKYKEEAP